MFEINKSSKHTCSDFNSKINGQRGVTKHESYISKQALAHQHDGKYGVETLVHLGVEPWTRQAPGGCREE
jgi:hypothetical protein